MDLTSNVVARLSCYWHNATDGLQQLLTAQVLRIMKLITALLFIACITASAAGNAQNVTLDAKDIPIEKVFAEFKKQTGYNFVYANDVLQNARLVNGVFVNLPLEEALKRVFSNQPLMYNIVDKVVVVKVKETLKVDLLKPSEQRTDIDITGRVTDADGHPLAGASVKVKGTDIGTTTDANGVYVLKGVDDEASLEISYAEYETVILKVNKRTSISIALKQEIGKLGEVIINKGYYTEKQRNTVGNVTTVTAKDIEKQPVQNPLLALQGRVPGLEVTQLTGLNGGGVAVRIQGRNSINSGLDPLIVVDGVPIPNSLAGTGSTLDLSLIKYGSALNYVNPSDIESIDILKDADATALYGNRAANGAILITTKKGKPGKSKVSLNLQQGWGKVGRHVDMLNTQQYLEMRREALKNDNRIASDNRNAPAPFLYSRDLTIWDTTRYTDWQKELIGGTAQYTTINLGISGGTQDFQYLVGTTFNRTTTVFPGNFDDKRGTVHFNVNSTPRNQRLKVQLSGSYSYDQNHLPYTDISADAILLAPNAPALYNSDGTLNWAPNAAGTSTWTNPLTFTENADFKNATNNLFSNLVINYRLLKGLTISGSIGYTNLSNKLFNPVRIESYAPENRNSAQRLATYSYRNVNTWIAEPQMNYDNQLWNGKFSMMVGTTIQKTTSDYLSIVATGFPTDQLMATPLAAITSRIDAAVNITTRAHAVFARMNYTMKDRYILNIIARRDGSNKFGDKAKFGNFWSVGGAWIFSDESFMQKTLPFLSFGKLRTSYGLTGNDQIPPFSYLSIYSIGNPGILYQGGVGMNGGGIPNPHLQWEETRKWQSGIDLGFFANRLNLGFTYARNRSTKQLIAYILPLITGTGAMTKNFPATIQNTSLEFVLNTINISGKYYKWETNLNVTIPRNKLVSFPGIENTSYASPTNGAGVVVGKPVGIKIFAPFAGINPATGSTIFYSSQGNNLITDAQPVVYRNLNTIWGGGINNRFQYKKVSVEFHIQFVRRIGPKDMYWNNGTNRAGSFLSNASNQPISVMNRWQKLGDVTSFLPFSTSTVMTGQGWDAYYDDDASYARLKNISLSWQMPDKWIQKMHLQGGRFYANAQNVATLTRYRGIDPESGATGMPPLRMITVGAQFEF